MSGPGPPSPPPPVPQSICLSVRLFKYIYPITTISSLLTPPPPPPHPKLRQFEESADYFNRTSSIMHCNENPIYLYPEIKLHGLIPNSYINISVSDLYTSRIGLPVWLQVHEYGNWETEHFNSVLEITRPRSSFISGNT